MAVTWTLAAAGAVLGLTLVLALAHPHPHPHTHGVCLVGGRSLQESRHLLGGRLPHCLRGIKPFRQHRSVLRHCKNQVKKRLITDRKDFKKDLLDSEVMEGVLAEAWEGVAACLVERLQLEAEDGTLNTQKLLTATAGMGGKDTWKVKYLRAMVVTCASNTSASNATQQLREVMECVRAGALEFCESKTAFARRWLQSAGEESVCSPVVVPPGPQEACVACAEELGVSEAMCAVMEGDDYDEEEGDSRAFYPDSTQLDPEEAEWAVQLCASERLGWYRPADGFLFTQISDAVSNFTGWEDIPQALENVTQAIVDCAPPLDGDVQVQALLWTSCFMRSYFDNCGFRSNLTSLFFPSFHRTMRREVRQLMRGLVELGELGDDEDDYHDEEDAELVDAGLLERSQLDEAQIEHSDAEGLRAKSANMKDASVSESKKVDKRGETKDDLEPITSEPSEDASSDIPEESDRSGTPPSDSSDTPPVDPSDTPPVASTEGASGDRPDNTSDKALAEPKGEALKDSPDETK